MAVPYKPFVAVFIGILMFSSGLFYLSDIKSDILIEVHSTYTKDGVRIVFDTIYKQEGEVSDMPVVLVFHGFSGNRKTMGVICINLAKNGFLVVPIDLRGHGDSEGYMSRLTNDSEGRRRLYETFEKDVLAVLDWLKDNNHGDLNRLILMGHSMGGGLAIFLGGRLPNVVATIGIAPGFAHDFINTSVPKNLLLIAGSKDRVVSPDYVYRLFEMSINDSGDSGVVYNIDGNFRKLYIDVESDHISVIFDSEVIEEIVGWANLFAFGGLDVEIYPPSMFVVPSHLALLGGIVVIVSTTFLIAFSWGLKRIYSRKVEYVEKRFLSILLPFISSLFIGWFLSIILFLVANILSRLIVANIVSSIIFGSAIGLYIGSNMSKRFGAKTFDLKTKLRSELSGNIVWLSMRLGAIYSILLIVIFYGTVGLNLVSTFSTSTTRNLYLPIVVIYIFPSVTIYEFFFRDTVKRNLDIGGATPLLSGLINFVSLYLFWLTSALLISTLAGINFWLFYSKFRGFWFPILATTALSEAIDEYFGLRIPQIIASTTLFSTIIIAFSPAML